MDITQIISLLSGVALFMFGMSLMGDGLKKTSGDKLEPILYKLSGTPLRAVLLGTGVTAVIKIISTPYLTNICCANWNCSIVAKFSINHTPTESNSHSPIIYAIAPPTIDPIDAATTVGTARRRFATIGGVIKTSGGTNKKIDSATVITNTKNEYMRVSALANINSPNFIINLSVYSRLNPFVIPPYSYRHPADARDPVDDICSQPVSFGTITQVLRSAKLDTALRRYDAPRHLYGGMTPPGIYFNPANNCSIRSARSIVSS